MTSVMDGPAAGVLISMQEACSLLGVSPATLRRWSDAGDVPAYTTPGGHRRFARDDIADLLVRPCRSPRPVAEAAAVPTTVLAVVTAAPTVSAVVRGRLARELAVLADRPDVLVLKTRERVEAYVAGGTAASMLPRLPHGAVTLDDADAVRHLVGAVCGLYSATASGDDVQAELISTYGARQRRTPLDPILDRMVQVALDAGRTAAAWLRSQPGTSTAVRSDALPARLESLVSEAGGEFCRWLRAEVAGAPLDRLTETAESRRRAELERLMDRLPGLGEGERRAVEEMSHRLVAAILHAPGAALDTAGHG